MTWFKVDDRFHSHPKVLATEPAALGLWVVAGAWSSANLLDGFVPDNALPRLLPDSEMLAEKLCTAGLWRRIRGGYQFHDWTDYNPSAEQIRRLQVQRAAAGRAGGLARSNVIASAKANGKQVSSKSDNPRPVPPPSTKGGRGNGGTTSSAAVPEVHPFKDSGDGKWCKCGLPKSNKIHPAA
jgi:hypothetical protein